MHFRYTYSETILSVVVDAFRRLLMTPELEEITQAEFYLANDRHPEFTIFFYEHWASFVAFWVMSCFLLSPFSHWFWYIIGATITRLFIYRAKRWPYWHSPWEFLMVITMAKIPIHCLQLWSEDYACNKLVPEFKRKLPYDEFEFGAMLNSMVIKRTTPKSVRKEHPFSARMRRDALTMLSSIPVPQHFIQPGRREAGTHDHHIHWLVDLKMPVKSETPAPNALNIAVDADYHFDDLGDVLDPVRPNCLITLQPTSPSGIGNDYSFYFDNRNVIHYQVSGDSYEHKVWNYEGTSCTVSFTKSRNSLNGKGYYGTMTYFNVRKQFLDPHHAMVFLYPSYNLDTPGAYLAQLFLKHRPIVRYAPHVQQGGTEAYVMEVDTPTGPIVSISTVVGGRANATSCSVPLKSLSDIFTFSAAYPSIKYPTDLTKCSGLTLMDNCALLTYALQIGKHAIMRTSSFTRPPAAEKALDTAVVPAPQSGTPSPVPEAAPSQQLSEQRLGSSSATLVELPAPVEQESEDPQPSAPSLDLVISQPQPIPSERLLPAISAYYTTGTEHNPEARPVGQMLPASLTSLPEAACFAVERDAEQLKQGHATRIVAGTNLSVGKSMGDDLLSLAEEFLSTIAEPIEPIPLVEIQRVLDQAKHKRQAEQHVLYPAVSCDGKAFVKTEAYETAKVARTITDVNVQYKFEYSTYTYAMAQLFKKQPWYAFGLSPRLVARRVSNVCGLANTLGLNLAETDFSKFEGTMPAVRAIERLFLMKCFSGEALTRVLDLHSMQIGARVRVADEFVHTVGERITGAPDTSIFNTLVNATFQYIASRLSNASPNQALQYLGVYGGDDGITLTVDGKEAEKLAVNLGMKLKMTIREPGSLITFLGRVYGPNAPDGDTNSVVDIVRAIRGLHFTSDVNADPALRFCQKVNALRITDPYLPCFKRLYQYVDPSLGVAPESYFASLCLEEQPFYTVMDWWVISYLQRHLPDINVPDLAQVFVNYEYSTILRGIPYDGIPPEKELKSKRSPVHFARRGEGWTKSPARALKIDRRKTKLGAPQTPVPPKTC